VMEEDYLDLDPIDGQTRINFESNEIEVYLEGVWLPQKVYVHFLGNRK
jgi:hypothetical protein